MSNKPNIGQGGGSPFRSALETVRDAAYKAGSAIKTFVTGSKPFSGFGVKSFFKASPHYWGAKLLGKTDHLADKYRTSIQERLVERFGERSMEIYEKAQQVGNLDAKISNLEDVEGLFIGVISSDIEGSSNGMDSMLESRYRSSGDLIKLGTGTSIKDGIVSLLNTANWMLLSYGMDGQFMRPTEFKAIMGYVAELANHSPENADKLANILVKLDDLLDNPPGAPENAAKISELRTLLRQVDATPRKLALNADPDSLREVGMAIRGLGKGKDEEGEYAQLRPAAKKVRGKSVRRKLN